MQLRKNYYQNTKKEEIRNNKKTMNKIIQFTILLGIIPLSLNAQTIDGSISGNTNVAEEEGEAHIAINPIDSSKMITGFMNTSQNGVDFKVYNSIDGGDSWQESQLNTDSLFFNDFPGNTLVGGGDVIFAYDKSGVLYCSWIYLSIDPSLPNPLDSALWTSYWATSIDNGNTFTLANGADHFFGRGKIGLNGGAVVHNFEEGITDRQWMSVDLSSGSNQNNLYIAYVNFTFNIAQSGLKVKTKLAGQNTLSNAVTAYAGNGQLTNIAVDTNGILHYTFADIAINNIYHVSSSDGGQTFSTPNLISNNSNLFPQQGSTTINSRENSAPSLAIDGANNLHLVWGDFPGGGQQPKAYYSSSSDGGISWTPKINLNTIMGNSLFMPVVSAKNNHVTIAGNVLDSLSMSEYKIASSIDNGTNFSTPITVSSGIIDFATAGQGVFIGDYSSAVRTNCNIYSLWTDINVNGRKLYIAKYDECNATGIVEFTPIETSFSIKNLYPVPAEDYLNVQIDAKKEEKLTLEIHNHLGQKIQSTIISLIKGDNEKKLLINDLASGNYMLRLINDKETFLTRKFVKK